MPTPTTGGTVSSTRLASGIIPLLLVVLAMVMAVVHPVSAAAQDGRSFVWDRVDVTVALRPVGTLHVTERDHARFHGGPFRQGYREIPMARIERLSNIRVSGGPDLKPYRFVRPDRFSAAIPNTYTFRRVGTIMRIEWSFPPATSTMRTFEIAFDADGALRVYDDASPPYQQISWIGVDRALTTDAPVTAASLTFLLPLPVDPDDVIVSGPGGQAPRDHTVDGQSWTWGARNLGPGDTLAASLQFPPLVSASKPSWQDASDRRELLTRQWGPQLTLLFLGIALLVAVGGGLAVLATWWTRGRDPAVGPAAQYVIAPPDDLPPGVVGALIDERADRRDIVATIVDLGRRGVVRVDQTETVKNFGQRDTDFALTLQDPEATLAPFERELLVAIFGGRLRPGEQVNLSEAKGGFAAAEPAIQRRINDELVRHGFFVTRPSRTRIFWRAAGAGLALLGVAGGWVGAGILGESAPTVPLAAAAVVVLGVLVYGVSAFMPAKTRAGAEAAANWMAFSRYLKDIAAFEQLEAAQDLFDRYLPYAIAFGIERSWVYTFARAGTPAPRWYGSRGWSTPSAGGSGAGGRWGSGGGSPVVPNLQSLSGHAGGSLQAMSGSLFGLFDVAGSAFGAQSGGSGSGGFGGGFGGGSFGGGGGGGGFS